VTFGSKGLPPISPSAKIQAGRDQRNNCFRHVAHADRGGPMGGIGRFRRCHHATIEAAEGGIR